MTAIPTNPVTNNMEANVINAAREALLCRPDNIAAMFVGLIIIPIPTNSIITRTMNAMTSLSTFVTLSFAL